MLIIETQQIIPFDDFVREEIVKMCVCHDIKKQKALLQKYMCMIHERNEDVLPGFVNPDLLLKSGFPGTYIIGERSEVHLNVYKYHREINRIPGALVTIKSFLQQSPKTNTES